MAVHVAIVTAPYDRLILDGRKTVECRLTKTPLAPFGRVTPGDRVFVKRSGGPFVAVAQVDRVWLADRLTPASVDGIRKQFDPLICGDPAYWKTRRDAKYATLIWLRDVRPCSIAPKYKTQNMRAWYTLDDAADPFGGNGRVAPTAAAKPADAKPIEAKPGTAACFDVTLTAAAIRRRYVRLADAIDRFPPASLGGTTKKTAGAPVELRLAGGSIVETDIIAPRRMFRWRGWGPWFAAASLAPGDRLRFTKVSRNAFTVRPLRNRS